MDILWSILPIVLEIAIPVVLVLIAWAVRALVKKLNVEQMINTEELIDKIVGRAVDCVEQLDVIARKKGESINSDNKLGTVLRLVEQELRHLNLPKLTGEILRTKIESYLQRRDAS